MPCAFVYVYFYFFFNIWFQWTLDIYVHLIGSLFALGYISHQCWSMAVFIFYFFFKFIFRFKDSYRELVVEWRKITKKNIKKRTERATQLNVSTDFLLLVQWPDSGVRVCNVHECWTFCVVFVFTLYAPYGISPLWKRLFLWSMWKCARCMRCARSYRLDKMQQIKAAASTHIFIYC